MGKHTQTWEGKKEKDKGGYGPRTESTVKVKTPPGAPYSSDDVDYLYLGPVQLWVTVDSHNSTLF